MVEIDERYKRGMIYTIRNIKDDEMIYVGSTINNLSKRFDNHKTCCKAGRACSLYSYVDNNDWTDFYIELYEAYPCNNKKELNRREGQVIREIGSINKCIAGRTQKEYKKDNYDKIKKWREDNPEYNKKYYEGNAEYFKEYYKDNIDKINEYRYKKVCCNICGAFSSKHNLAKHQKTKSCMSKIPNNTDIPTDNHI